MHRRGPFCPLARCFRSSWRISRAVYFTGFSIFLWDRVLSVLCTLYTPSARPIQLPNPGTGQSVLREAIDGLTVVRFLWIVTKPPVPDLAGTWTGPTPRLGCAHDELERPALGQPHPPRLFPRAR